MCSIQYSCIHNKLLYQIAFLFFLLAGLSTQAQTTKQKIPKTAFTLSYEGRDLISFLAHELRYPPSVRLTTDSCKGLLLTVCTSFTVSANGKVTNIVFSDRAPEAIQEEIKRVLTLTNTHWKATGSIKQQTMVLPILFARGDCLDKNMEGLTGTQYQNAFKDVFVFLIKSLYQDIKQLSFQQFK